MLSRRALSAGALMSILTLLVAVCGAPSAPRRSTEERPVQQAAESAASALAPRGDLIFARAMEQDAELVVIDADTGKTLRRFPGGVPSPDWSLVYRAEFSSGNTLLRAIDTSTGVTLRERVLTGRYLYELPLVGLGEAAGLSPNGQWLALRARGADNVTKSAFLVVDTDLRAPSTLVELPGDFAYDAVASSGSTLYLEEHVYPGRPSGAGYRIRAYDLRAGQLLAGAIADKGTSGDMAGTRVAALPSPDGQWVYSLYTRPDKPFIHALNMTDKYSVCLFLPSKSTGNGEEQLAWSFTPSPDGRRAYAVNALMGVVAEVDRMSAQITHSATFSVVRADEPSLPEALLRWFVPIAEAKAEGFSHAVVSPDGKTLYLTGDFGRRILALSTKTLEVTKRIATSTPVMGLGVSRDGTRLYAIANDGRSLLRMDARSGDALGSAWLETRALRILRVASR